MFKGTMRRGLEARLVQAGATDVVAFALANVVYPDKGNRYGLKPSLLPPAETASVVEAFLDKDTMTEEQVLDTIWGKDRKRTT